MKQATRIYYRTNTNVGFVKVASIRGGHCEEKIFRLVAFALMFTVIIVISMKV